ncbi:MAG: NUMOD3 domain-containing DNA-binding protein [Patescibacteria group bacterium]|jgi:hypothetical protein
MPPPKDPKKYDEWIRKNSEAHKNKHPSEETRNKLKGRNPWNKGIPLSEEAKQKLSESCKGRIPWNKGVPHKQESKNKMSIKKKGIPLSEEHKKHLSESHKGLKPNVTPESIEKNRIAHLGKKASEETKEKMSISHKGKSSWNKGIKTPIEIRNKMSKSMKGIKKSDGFRKNMSGENNLNWKGGITELDKAIRALPEMFEWRRKVFERDHYRDCFTGSLGNHNIEAHHIVAVSLIMERFNITSIEDALNCEDMWNIDNGVTMFKNSHIEHHKKYKLQILPKEYYFKNQ